MAQGNSHYWKGRITAYLKEAEFRINTDDTTGALVYLDCALEMARSNLPDCPTYRCMRAHIVAAHQALVQS